MGELREIWPGMTVFASGNVRMVVQSIDGDKVVIETGLTRTRLEMTVSELRAATEASTYRTEVGADGEVRTRLGRFSVPVQATDEAGRGLVDIDGVAVQATHSETGEPLFEDMVVFRTAAGRPDVATRVDYDGWRGSEGASTVVQLVATNDTGPQARAARDQILKDEEAAAGDE